MPFPQPPVMLCGVMERIEISKDKRGEQPFSVDENILHSSAEGKILEDPWQEAP